MIAIVHSIYSQSVHAPASHAGLMDNEAEQYCTCKMKEGGRTGACPWWEGVGG